MTIQTFDRPRAGLVRRDVLGLAAALALGASPRARAQGGGDRPVRFILPVSAGSGVDTIVRAASQALGVALKHPVVIENQPGAGGITGTTALVKSPPDGFTLGVVSNNHVIFPSVYQSLSIATTLNEGLVVGMRSMSGNPYDGHTLAETLQQVGILAEHKPTTAKGYQGVEIEGGCILCSGPEARHHTSLEGDERSEKELHDGIERAESAHLHTHIRSP